MSCDAISAIRSSDISRISSDTWSPITWDWNSLVLMKTAPPCSPRDTHWSFISTTSTKFPHRSTVIFVERDIPVRASWKRMRNLLRVDATISRTPTAWSSSVTRRVGKSSTTKSAASSAARFARKNSTRLGSSDSTSSHTIKATGSVRSAKRHSKLSPTCDATWEPSTWRSEIFTVTFPTAESHSAPRKSYLITSTVILEQSPMLAICVIFARETRRPSRSIGSINISSMTGN